FCWVTPAAAANREYVRFFFLEAMTYILLCGRHLTPIHASSVGLEGRGVLLCGGSGAGKSTLAWACARRGWSYLCEDVAYLVGGRTDRLVVANAPQIGFLDDALKLFPELSARSLA